MAAINNFNVTQGSTFIASLVATDANGTATDLDTYSVRGSIKLKYSDSASLVDLTLARVADDPNANPLTYADGKINVSLTDAQTTLLPVTQGVYDIEIYKTDDVRSVFKGKVNIFPEVTS